MKRVTNLYKTLITITVFIAHYSFAGTPTGPEGKKPIESPQQSGTTPSAAIPASESEVPFFVNAHNN